MSLLSWMRALLVGLVVLSVTAPSAVLAAPQPLDRAHAHNDYEHDRPLFDALANGFTSVEADVFLVDGQLLVAHEEAQTRPDRTLQSLYLDPLRRRVQANGGRVYPTPAPFQLLIDIKSDGPATYRALHRVLARYEGILTTYNAGQVRKRAVTAVVSGNRPRGLMAAQRVRHAFYDGRLSDLDREARASTLGGPAKASFMPLISDNWFTGARFTWTGAGPMPPDEHARLHQIVATAHANGQRVRFYNTPDIDDGPLGTRHALWGELIHADVDHVNTDDLPGLRQFLLANDPQERRPAA